MVNEIRGKVIEIPTENIAIPVHVDIAIYHVQYKNYTCVSALKICMYINTS